MSGFAALYELLIFPDCITPGRVIATASGARREAIQWRRPQAGLLRLRLAMTATENVMISGNLNNKTRRSRTRTLTPDLYQLR
jgi:hypothetical protein